VPRSNVVTFMLFESNEIVFSATYAHNVSMRSAAMSKEFREKK